MKTNIPRLLLGFVLLTGAAPAVAAEVGWQRPFSEVAALPARAPDRVLAYGGEASQYVELWLPADLAAPAPVVVLLHGGCWLADYGIKHIRPLAAALADAGFAVWALEYRRVGEAGGGWPGTFHDIAAGVDFLATVDEPRLDRSRVVLAGHSAGGHLALWAAGRSRLAHGSALQTGRPLMPRAVLGLAAITDLAAYARGGNSCERVAVRLMDGAPGAQPERYAEASPAELGVAAPAVLLHGGADTIVDPAQADALPGGRVVLLPEAGHFDLIHPQTPAFDRIVSLIEEMVGDAR